MTDEERTEEIPQLPVIVNHTALARLLKLLERAVMIMILGLVLGLVAIALFFDNAHDQIAASKKAADAQAIANAGLIDNQNLILAELGDRQTTLSAVDRRILKALRGLHIRCSTVEGTTSTLKCVLIVPKIVIPNPLPHITTPPSLPTSTRTRTPIPTVTCSPNPGGHCKPTPAPAKADMSIFNVWLGGIVIILGFTYIIRPRRAREGGEI